MRLKRLHLIYFRNYDQKDLILDDSLTILLGKNGAGKTNILEAINLLATGESFRAQKIEEMISFGKDVSHVAGLLETQEETKIQVRLTRGFYEHKRVQKRAFSVNGVSRQKKDFTGVFRAVAFLPEDLRLIEGSPSRRRNFLDQALVQVDREYVRSLGSYDKALRRRNKLLGLIQEGRAQKTALAFFDSVLIKDGNILTQKRRELIEYLNSTSSQVFPLRIEYDFSAISEARIAQYAREEVASGHTLVGPHKDDYHFYRTDQVERDLELFGSRGEHRMAVLWLKLGQIDFFEHKLKVRPVLLLDDIFSELDYQHREIVINLIDQQQTIITTADKLFLQNLNKGKLVQL